MFTLFFDGQCALCQASVTRLQRLDARQALRFADASLPAVKDQFPELASRNIADRMQVLTLAGEWLEGYDALVALMGVLPRWISIFQPILGLKFMRVIGRLSYDWIARHRHRLALTCAPTISAPSHAGSRGP